MSLPVDAPSSIRISNTDASIHPSEASNSQTQPKEEKALSLTIRSPSRRSNHPVGIREIPPPQPISSGRVRLAIHTGSQSACLEFADSKRDRLLLANPASRFDSNLSLSRMMR